MELLVLGLMIFFGLLAAWAGWRLLPLIRARCGFEP